MNSIEIQIGTSGILELRKDILDIIKIVNESDGIVYHFDNQVI